MGTSIRYSETNSYMLVLLARLVIHTSYRLVLRTTLADSIWESNSYILMSIESWITHSTIEETL